MSESTHPYRRHARTETTARGFTLIELLMVVATIAILAGLALPALAHSRTKSKSAGCLANVHQIGIVMRLYADDDTVGRLPPDPSIAFAFTPQATNSWFGYLTPYLAGSPDIGICAADRFGRLRSAAGRSSYLRNAYCASEFDDINMPYPIPGPNREPEPTHSSSLRWDLFPRPAETFLTFEVSNGPADMAQGFSMLRDQAFPSTWDAGWPHVLADIEPYRHGDCANYLFADLHTASLPARILKARIDAGDNFSLIQR